jgi:prepilin signal peptidase PulO-like enzyme (type II secretory pathway)
MTGLVLMLLGTPLDGVADRLARIRMQGDVGRHWWSYLNPAFAGAALVALAYGLAVPHGWGMVLLAFTTLAFLVALTIEIEGHKPKAAILLAERKGMTWLMLPFAAFGLWNVGLALLFAYAAASFFWAQHQAHAAVRTPLAKS